MRVIWATTTSTMTGKTDLQFHFTHGCQLRDSNVFDACELDIEIGHILTDFGMRDYNQTSLLDIKDTHQTFTV